MAVPKRLPRPERSMGSSGQRSCFSHSTRASGHAWCWRCSSTRGFAAAAAAADECVRQCSGKATASAMCRRCRKPSARCRPSQKARLDKSKRAAGFRGHRLKLRRLFANVQVHELFLEQAKLTPTATALVLPHKAKTVVTYQESSCSVCVHAWIFRSRMARERSREPPAESACPARRGAGRSRPAVGRGARTARPAPPPPPVTVARRGEGPVCSMRVSPARREWRDRGFIFAAKQRAGGVDPRRFAVGCRLPAHGRHWARGSSEPERHA